MPQFGHHDGFDTVTLVTGPSHVLLGIRFGGPQSTAFEVFRRTSLGGRDHGPLDERKIAEAIADGVASANTRADAQVTVAQAFYVEGDSPRYDLFEHGAFLLASRRILPPGRSAPR